jgi:hypothetical protein
MDHTSLSYDFLLFVYFCCTFGLVHDPEGKALRYLTFLKNRTHISKGICFIITFTYFISLINYFLFYFFIYFITSGLLFLFVFVVFRYFIIHQKDGYHKGIEIERKRKKYKKYENVYFYYELIIK